MDGYKIMLNDSSNRNKRECIYKIWWLHRRCRVSSDKPFKKVIGISLYELRGSGIVKLTYDDRSVDIVGSPNSFTTPRKIDVEVEPGSKPRGIKVI